MPVNEIRVPGLVALLEAVAGLPNSQYWFRGVRCGEFQLKPKIYRDGKTSDQVFDRELRLLTRFRQRSQAYWREGYPQSDWEHLFAMQHFGLPTRLLDWSENLFVAAYFASEEGVKNHAHDCQSTIWAVDPVAWNRAMPVLSEFGESVHVLNTVDEEIKAYSPAGDRRRQKSPVAMYGSHNTGRILAQKGTFVVWGSDDRGMEEVASGSDAEVHKFVIEERKADTVQLLRKVGFTPTMFFPDLVALAEELESMEGWR